MFLEEGMIMTLEAQELQIETELKVEELRIKKQESEVNLAIKSQELKLKKQQMEINEAELSLEVLQGRPVGIGPT